MTPSKKCVTFLFAKQVFQEIEMRPLKRSGVNKHRSARKFRGQSKRTKGANMSQVMRGGIRF